MGRSRRLRLALLLAVGLLGPVPLLSAQSQPVTGPEERGLDSDGPAEPPAERPTESNEVREFQISAERFAFTPNAIEVKEGEKVRLVIWSNDVTHGFAIKKLDIDEVIPQGGEPVTIEFVAAEAGRFPFECSLYCGRGHEGMTGILTVAPRTAVPGPVLALPPPQEAYPGEFDDLSLDLAQPDFTLITLPTTLRVPRYRAAFRVTHRFGRALGAGSLGDLLQDLFGFDSGALMGLDLRFGLMPGTQVGIYRTSERTIQVYGQRNILRQNPDRSPVGLGLFLAVEGLNNFRSRYSLATGFVVSRNQGRHAAFYAEPIWIDHTDVVDLYGRLVDDSHRDWTLMVGLGARVRVLSTVYLVGEFVPRVGFSPGDHPITFGLEKRVGGHMFQVNFSNSVGQTLRQVVRLPDNDNWFIGFNITRKFY